MFCELCYVFLNFVSSPKEPPPPPPPEVPWSEEPSHVVHLTEEDFKPFLKRKKHVLLMFYAPCKFIFNLSTYNGLYNLKIY